MGSYAENEQDAREYAELKREFAEEELEQVRFNETLLDEEKPVVTMDEIMEHRFQQRNAENAGRHMNAQQTWADWMKNNRPDDDNRLASDRFERESDQDLIIKEIYQIVDNNILYGSPPYSLESAEEILLDIINDLTSVKERLGVDSSEL